MKYNIERPIFFIGMGRSGTTIIFEAFSRHPKLSWPSSYCRMFPSRLWINSLRRVLDNQYIKLYSHKQQYGKKRLLNDYFPQPDEAYAFWNMYAGSHFGRHCLYGETCDQHDIVRARKAAAEIMMWQGKPRFTAKFTGPPRILYLKSIFPDAIFVNVIRDGRAVVHSLLNVAFWKDKGGLTRPFWDGFLSDHDITIWENAEYDPGVLAAMEWRRVIEMTRDEAKQLLPDAYHEIHYEDYVCNSHEVLSHLCKCIGLNDSSAIHEFVEQGGALLNMNSKYKEEFSGKYIRLIEKHMEPALSLMGY